ncbi:V-type ATP synthase subunit I [Haloarcula amylovorans]|uniref:DUF2130 domain-containing protein n=1 Tax=Haloarcula amylovorans TaxID=2562280 RepID=UPI00107662D8|nr:DUF2130 domain-containing protein [Halomicroarcula amylolytica]
MATTNSIQVDTATDRVEVQELTIHDSDLAEYLSQFEEHDREREITRALRVGATTLELADTSKEVEFVKREFAEMEEAFNEEIDEVREELEDNFGDDGQVATLLETHLGDEGKLQRHLDDALGEDGEFVQRLDDELGEDGQRFQEALDPDRDGTPINRLKEFLREEVRSELRDEIRELQEKLEREDAAEEMRQQTPLKGEDFEEDLEALLDDLAYGTNNMVEYTGETEGALSGRQIGDFVFTLGDTDQRIVIEAKSEQNYTQPKIKEELAEAIENRDADYGIFVSECESYVPDKVGYLHEFDNEMLVVCLSADEDDSIDARLLNIAHNWARMRTVQAHVDTGDSLDTEIIQTQVSEVRDTIDRFQTVRTKCTDIKSTAQDIDDLLSEIQADVNTQLNHITAELSKTGAED